MYGSARVSEIRKRPGPGRSVYKGRSRLSLTCILFDLHLDSACSSNMTNTCHGLRSGEAGASLSRRHSSGGKAQLLSLGGFGLAL